MAKITDTSKIERIKEAAMKVLVEKGYSGAIITEIAKTANVANGYLYRYYKSKTELYQDVYKTYINTFHNRIIEIFEKNNSIKNFIKEYVLMLFTESVHDPVFFKFLFMMSHDYTFPIPEKSLASVKNICEKIIKKGIQTGEIASNRNSEEVYSLIIGLPPKFLDSRLRGFFKKNKSITNDEMQRISQMCLNALK